MTEVTSIKINSDLLEGLKIKFTDMSFNEMMATLAKKENYLGRQMCRTTDIIPLAQMIQAFVKENPHITNEEIYLLLKAKYPLE